MGACSFLSSFFRFLTGQKNFNPDLQVRLIMGIGASLMAGWTLLLMWGVQKPKERRFVIFLTAFPVVFGLFIVTLISFLNSNNSNLWILIKTAFLFVVMINSYIIAGKQEIKDMLKKAGIL